MGETSTMLNIEMHEEQKEQLPDPSSENNTSINLLGQWVDYLPNQTGRCDNDNDDDVKDPLRKRLSMDPSETNLTETNDSMDMEDWPDSSSLEGYSMLPPAMLLGGDDPMIQQELLLLDSSCSHDHHHIVDQGNYQYNTMGLSYNNNINTEDPSVAPELFAHSLEELLEQRRNQLAAYMQASMRTRQFLEPHIRQRAGLANILTQIERSSITLQQHLLHTNDLSDGSNPSSDPLDALIVDAVSSVVASPEHCHSPPPVGDDDDDDDCNHSVDMTGIEDVEDEDVEDFAASVLADDTDCLL